MFEHLFCRKLSSVFNGRMETMTLDENHGHSEHQAITSQILRYSEQGNSDMITKSNSIARIENEMSNQKEEQQRSDHERINGQEFITEQQNANDAMLKDRYGKPKHHGTIWEPPIVYINTELSSSKTSPVRHHDAPLMEHRFHEHPRSSNSSPKSKKAPCHCCHTDSTHFRSQTEGIVHHHSSSASHKSPYESDCHHEVFYLPIETEERASQYHVRSSCNCASCQKASVDGIPSKHSPHLKEVRREASSHETLRSLLPDIASNTVSYLSFTFS